MILNGLFQQELKAVNVGLESFKDALKDAGFQAVQVEWKPPAGGNEKVLAALRALMKK